MLRLLSDIISENAPDDFAAVSNNPSIASLVKEYIDSNFEQNIQLDHIAQYFGYSKFHIEKLFKREYNTSPISYRNSKRLIKAASLLMSHSVTATSQQVGFSSVYAFSRAFRSFYGVSPTEYVHESKNRDSCDP